MKIEFAFIDKFTLTVKFIMTQLRRAGTRLPSCLIVVREMILFCSKQHVQLHVIRHSFSD